MVRIAFHLTCSCIVFLTAVLGLLKICFKFELLDLNDILCTGIFSEDYGSEPLTAQDLMIRSLYWVGINLLCLSLWIAVMVCKLCIYKYKIILCVVAGKLLNP